MVVNDVIRKVNGKMKMQRKKNVEPMLFSKKSESKSSNGQQKIKPFKKERKPKLNEDDELNDSSQSQHLSAELSVTDKKRKKNNKSKMMLNLENQDDSVEQLKESPRKKKKLHPKEEVDQAEESFSKKKSTKASGDKKYKPGMLSDVLQVKKYGQVVLPWDPSFGLDKKHYDKIGNEEEDGNTKRNLKVNPLFDLSKRSKVTETTPNQTKLSVFFVGNLPLNTSLTDVKKLFGKHGKIKKIKFQRKVAKASMKNSEETAKKAVDAFVKFFSVKSVERVLSLNGSEYKGHHLRVNLDGDEPDKTKTVFVGNLAWDAQDDDLWKIFQGCGEIGSVRIIRDNKTQKGKGIAFVNFKTEEAVRAAMELNGATALGRDLRVERWSKNVPSLSNEATIKRKRVNKRQRKQSKNKTETVEDQSKTEKSSADSEEEHSKIKEADMKTSHKVKQKKRKHSNEEID